MNASTNPIEQDLFGLSSLGYILIESQRLDAWRDFCENGLGLHTVSTSDDELAFRIDEHQRRLIVRRGPGEDVVALGIQVKDVTTLGTLLGRIEEHDLSVSQGTEKQCQQRGVKSFWGFDGPKNQRIELFIEAEKSCSPPELKVSGFITGEAGMGHVAITSRAPDAMQSFWQTLFNARVSDSIIEKIAGTTVDIVFLRLNKRHHSIAIAATRGVRIDPIRTRVQHVNMLVREFEDMTRTFRRLKSLGYEMAHEIGQHPNDKEVSFYVISPSGFEVEIGWNALTVDEAQWAVTEYRGISLWGHKPEKTSWLSSASINAGNFQRGLRSLMHPEYTPIQGP